MAKSDEIIIMILDNLNNGEELQKSTLNYLVKESKREVYDEIYESLGESYYHDVKKFDK